MVFTEPMEAMVKELGLAERLELGPFDDVYYEDGCFYGDSKQIAEVFEESLDDMTAYLVGHPAAGKVFVPRTFHQSERDDPEYPGKPYGRVNVESR